MGRLTNNTIEDRLPIGRDGLLAFVDELNDKRARMGISGRYSARLVDGKLTMVAPFGGYPETHAS